MLPFCGDRELGSSHSHTSIRLWQSQNLIWTKCLLPWSHTKKIVQAYRKFIKSATLHHRQVSVLPWYYAYDYYYHFPERCKEYLVEEWWSLASYALYVPFFHPFLKSRWLFIAITLTPKKSLTQCLNSFIYIFSSMLECAAWCGGIWLFCDLRQNQNGCNNKIKE